jgi:hypothetical protein
MECSEFFHGKADTTLRYATVEGDACVTIPGRPCISETDGSPRMARTDHCGAPWESCKPDSSARVGILILLLLLFVQACPSWTAAACGRGASIRSRSQLRLDDIYSLPLQQSTDLFGLTGICNSLPRRMAGRAIVHTSTH